MPHLGRSVASCAALAFAAACAGSPVAPFPAGSQSVHRAQTSASSLLYVSDWSLGKIFIFSFPGGSAIGSIADNQYPLGLCSDARGNVWVTNFGAASNQIVEYAHGGTQPIAQLNDKFGDPRGCSVDPTTGNLAVVNGGAGNVVVYPAGSMSTPRFYAPGVAYPFACAYDGAGNLFVDGYHLASGDRFGLGELPAGKSYFVRLHIVGKIGLPGNIQWDGHNLADGDFQSSKTVYVLQITKRPPAAKLVNTITLQGPVVAPTDGVQFWIGGGTLVMPFGTSHLIDQVGYWNYPAGGSYTSSLGGFGAAELYGVTVSVSPSPRPL